MEDFISLNWTKNWKEWTSKKVNVCWPQQLQTQKGEHKSVSSSGEWLCCSWVWEWTWEWANECDALVVPSMCLSAQG